MSTKEQCGLCQESQKKAANVILREAKLVIALRRILKIANASKQNHRMLGVFEICREALSIYEDDKCRTDTNLIKETK